MKFSSVHFFSFLCWSSSGISSANVLMTPQSDKQILRISTKHFPPFMYEDSKGNFYNGIDFQLVLKIAKMLNMSLYFRTASKQSELCYNVAMNVSDICIGGIFPNENTLKYALMSVTYASDDLTWCVSKVEMMPMYLAFMLICQPEVWLLIIFGYGYTSGFVLYLLIQFDRKYEHRNNRDWHYTTWLVALPVALGISSNFRPVTWTSRTFYAFFLVSAFFGCQLILTRYFYFLHLQIPWHQISSFNEIIDKDFDLVGSPDAFDVLKRSEKISSEKMESFHICEDAKECLPQLLNRNNVAAGGSRQNFINSPLKSHSKVVCWDNIVTYPVALYMRRDFNWIEKVNGIIQRLFEAGFFLKWKKTSEAKVEYEIPYSIPPRLQMAHIIAPLMFLIACGSIMSTSTFVVENIIWWKMKQQRKRRFWIYLEHFVDGERHYLKNLPERLELQNQHSQIPFPYLD